jgi:diaminopimelate decarboxylase
MERKSDAGNGQSTCSFLRILFDRCERDKTKRREKNYCIVDGGMHHLHYDGQIRGIYRPHFSIRPEIRTGKEREWIICGELCTANDILMQNVSIKNLREGDIFIFENAGAYSMTEGMSLFLSHSLPKAVLYSRKKGVDAPS